MSELNDSTVVPDAPLSDTVAPEPQKSWLPTRKFIGAAVIGLLAIGGHALASHGWDTAENAELMTLLASLAGAYFVTNDATPGGVPVKDDTV